MQHRIRIGRAGTVAGVVLLAAACAGSPEGGDRALLPAATGTSAPAPIPVPSATTPEVSAEDAVTIALDAVGGGQVVETDIDEFEIAIQVWEITVVGPDGVRRDVSVDMRNGSIVGNDADD